jgi:putative membrane protein
MAARERSAVEAAATGTAFGLLVWTASYLGLLPSAGILSPATAHPARRNALMIVAHVIWGVTLGLLFDLFDSENRQTGAPLSTSSAPHRDAR